MSLIVQKFGGSSVADAEKIKHVARRVIECANEGNQVCVVVSAMGDTTDELIDLANSVTDTPRATAVSTPMSASAVQSWSGRAWLRSQ